MARDLEVLNSNPTPLVVDSVHIQVHDRGLPDTSETSMLPIHTVANTTVRPYVYTTVLHVEFASRVPGNYSGILTIHLNGTQPLVVPYTYTCSSVAWMTRSIIEGFISAPSPLFYCLKPSIQTRILPIPLRLANHFPVPVAVTRVGIADVAVPYITVSDQWNVTRFAVGLEVDSDADEPHGGLHSAAEQSLYVPLRSLLCNTLSTAHVSLRTLCECRQRAVFSTTLWIHTNLTSIPVDIVIYDGQLSTYVSNNLLSSPYSLFESIMDRLIDGESINWGTRLTPVLSATSLLSLNLDMGYVHPNDHRYQTVVLYNRNPVSVEATIRSSNLPHVSFYPIFRAQLNNQTMSEASLPNCSFPYLASS